jgi:hypothetical protein
MIPMFLSYKKYKQRTSGERGSLQTPPGRGDFPIWLALGMWLIGMSGWIYLVHWLIPHFPFGFLLAFGFAWTPLNSYVSARTQGILSRDLFQIPYLKESVVILSRYEEIDIWFVALPSEDYGGGTSHWRKLELTGTRFTSYIAADLITLPILLISGILVWHFVWKIAPIPSAQYPYAQTWWPMWATNRCLWVTALRDGKGEMLQAIRGNYVMAGFGASISLYALIWVAKMPSMWFYGTIAGLGGDPGMMLPTLAGALVGRFYMIKRFGLKRWYTYTPVLMAGFSCGTGLTGMATVAIALVSKAVIVKPF